MTNLLLAGLSTVARMARWNFVSQTRRIRQVQTQFLRSLLQHHNDTELGRCYRLAEIQTLDQFRERVPITSYSNYEAYIERMANGETNLLTPDPVVFFNLSSGSTGKRKLVPVTQRSRRAVARANRVAMGFAIEAARKRGLPLGKLLFTSPAQSLGQTQSGIPVGPVSTSDLRLMGGVYRQVFAYPFEALQISDTLARHYICLLFALRDRDLGLIGATFPVLALQLAYYLDHYANELIHDLKTGTIASQLAISPDIRQSLERQWSAHPQRAAELQTILQTEGRLTPHRAFPHLSLIITARGGTSNFYFERFSEYYGSTPVFGGTYAASEAVFGVHRDLNTDGVILAVESGFYEFVPEHQWDLPQPETLLPWEVKVGDRYRILVTNYAGFYRYDIGDVVEIEGFYEQTPILMFRHRQGGVISSTTEKTSEFHVIQVMQALQQEFNVALENFCVTLAEQDIPPPYIVNIELAPGESIADPIQFLARFDQRLQDVQVSYALKRPEPIPAPRLRILPAGSFALLRQRLIQRGVAETQFKFPHISDDRTLLADLPVEREMLLEPVQQ